MADITNTASGTMGGGKYPRLNSLKNDPVARDMVAKLVSADRNGGMKRRANTAAPGETLVRRTSDQTTQSINDASNIFQLLPDTRLAMQILVSSILSPKDMLTTELSYKVQNKVMDGKVSGALIQIIQNYFEETYKIKSFLPDILEDCLFKKGSYPVMVLPESSIDDVINSDSRTSLESLRGELNSNQQPRKSIGILGGPHKRQDTWSLESFQGGGSRVRESECVVTYGNGRRSSKLKDALPGEVTVTDNLSMLKFPQLIEKMRKERIGDVLGAAGMGFETRASMEADKNKDKDSKDKDNKSKAKNKSKVDKVSDHEFAQDVFPRRNYKQKPYVALKTGQQLTRPTEGHPVVIKLPPESVIPVHVPSNPSDHIGYFVLLDQFGNPLNRTEETDHFKNFSSNLEKSDIGTQLLEATSRAANGRDGVNRAKSLDKAEAVRLYADIVEQDLISRLKNGVYGEGVEISRPMDVYQVMFSRALAAKGTQVLYVPAELVTYFAFDYMDNGVGKSLLEDNKILASIRSVLMFSNTMSAIKNSTGRTVLNIELDEDEVDPEGAVEYMLGQYMSNQQIAMPIGAQSATDIVDFLQQANVEVQVSGNSAYPQTKMESEERARSITQIDRELSEEIKSQFFMGLELSPETVDQSKSVEFATSIVSSNLLLAKRVMAKQDILTPLLQDHIVKYTYNSRVLWDDLAKAVEENKKELNDDNKDKDIDDIVRLFLDSLTIELPRPDTAKMETQAQHYKDYTDALNDMVDAYFGEGAFMLEQFSDVSGSVQAVRAAVIAYFQREWLRKNNVLPELQNLTLTNDEGEPVLNMAEVQGEHMKIVGKTIAELMAEVGKDSKARDKILGPLDKDANNGGIGQSGTGSVMGGDDTSGGFGGDDSSGDSGGDFSF